MAQKQKLAQMVMQKMRQKKEAQQRNRPHYEAIQLQINFFIEENTNLKQSIKALNEQKEQQRKLYEVLRDHAQELENTGKKNYPVIVIKPEFIASENVSIGLKDFYRKAANTFLKSDIIKKQKDKIYQQKEQEIKKEIQEITKLEQETTKASADKILLLQKHRMKVLKEDLRRRALIECQDKARQQMQKLTEENRQLLKEFEIKKENLGNRMKYSQELKLQIAEAKQRIETRYNPVSYREHLRQIFDVRIKNEHIEKNLINVIDSMNSAKILSENCKKLLASRGFDAFLGKTADTPSSVRGGLQRRMVKEKHLRCQSNPKNLRDIIGNEEKVRSQSQSSRIIETVPSIQRQSLRAKNRSLRKNSSLKSVASKNYNSLKTLRSTLKSTTQSDRTRETMSFAGGNSMRKTLNF